MFNAILLNGKLNKQELINYGLKGLLVVTFKILYDNIQKWITSNIKLDDCRKLITWILMILGLKNGEITEVLTTQKLNSYSLSSFFNVMDIKKEQGFFIKFIYGILTLVDSSEGKMEFFSVRSSFKQSFLDEHKLQVATKVTSIETDYKVLILNIIYTDGKEPTKEYKWVKPSWITSLFDYEKNREFIEMIREFVTNTIDTEDYGATAFMVDSPPGVGKTTIQDLIYREKLVNTILRINMMNFVSCDDDFETIIRKVVCSFPCKSSNEIWAISIDEIDKWLPEWVQYKVRLMFSLKENMDQDQIRNFIINLYHEFYISLQRLLDCELITKIPRLIIKFYVNNGNSIWIHSNEHHDALKSRIINLKFDYCNAEDVERYLHLVFEKIKVTRISRGEQFSYDDNLLNNIQSDIKISFR